MRAPFNSDAPDMVSDDQNTVASEEGYIMDKRKVAEESSKKNSRSSVFGICLDHLMIRTPKLAVPFVLSRLCCYIEKHGLCKDCLFQDNEEKELVEHLKMLFNKCGDAPLESAGDIPSVSKLLKMFFEELPEPLIPVRMQSAFINDMEKLISNSSDCIKHLKCLVAKLPETVFCVLKYLSHFLLRISSHHDMNGLNSANLGVIFGPIIFRPAEDDPLICIIVKNITHCFVSDYYSIFEGDAELSVVDESKTFVSDPLLILPSTLNKMQMSLHPSSVMPFVPMQPLRVVIPPDDVLPGSEQSSSDSISVPVLLIERQIATMDSKTVHEVSSEANINDVLLDDIILSRKRKERRNSVIESQFHYRSNSEERPAVEISSESNKVIRRCSSHDEIKESYKPENEETVSVQLKICQACEIESNYEKQLENLENEEEVSPHPPKPKRRELDTFDHMYHEIHSQYSSELQPWFKNTSVCKEENKKQTVDFVRKRGQVCSAVKNEISSSNMDLSSYSEQEGDRNSEIVLEDMKSYLPRSASCPVAKKDDENFSEVQNETLSLSWDMLLNSGDNEPVRSDYLPWSIVKNSSDDTVLSPSINLLRKSSSYEAPLSPSAYRSYLCSRSSSLDSSIPPSPPVEQEDFGKSLLQDDVSLQIKQLTKKIHALKKKIRRFEERYETEFGYRPSHAEKTNYPEAKKLMTDLHKARKELKAIKEECHLTSCAAITNWRPIKEAHILEDTTNYPKEDNVNQKEFNSKSKPSLQTSFGETMKSLEDDRRTANRPELIEDMTKDQVHDEKVAMQKALLHFESIHGKPSKKHDRNTIRPLYDRYRNIKRLLVKTEPFSNTCVKTKETCSELQPIIEHETMDFSSPQHRRAKDSHAVENAHSVAQSMVETVSSEQEESFCKSTCSQYLDNKYNNSNLHELPLSEMIYQQQQAKAEKRRLRKILKEFEGEFQRLNGRKVQKEDKVPVEALYAEYKHVKARLRLLEALVSKHDEHDLL